MEHSNKNLKLYIKEIIIDIILLSLAGVCLFLGISGRRKLNEWNKVDVRVEKIEEIPQDRSIVFEGLFEPDKIYEVVIEDKNNSDFHTILSTDRDIEAGDKLSGYYDKENQVYYLELGIDVLMYPLITVMGLLLIVVVVILHITQ